MASHPVRPDTHHMEHTQEHGPVGTRRFRIWVRGRLGEGFGEGLAGIEQHDVPAGTMLSGVLLDQSQVYSTLDLLRSLGIDVLRFEVDPPDAPSCAGLTEGGDPPSEADRPHEANERPGVIDEGHDQEKG